MIDFKTLKAGDQVKTLLTSCWGLREGDIYSIVLRGGALGIETPNNDFHPLVHLCPSWWDKVKQPVKHFNPIYDFGPTHHFWHVQLEQDDTGCGWSTHRTVIPYGRTSITKPSAYGWGPPGKLVPDPIFNDGGGRYEARISSLNRELARLRKMNTQQFALICKLLA